LATLARGDEDQLFGFVFLDLGDDPVNVNPWGVGVVELGAGPVERERVVA
jgi:hypothetical protein